MTDKKLISVIVPVYNEELVLPLFYVRMTQVMDGLKDYNWKVIFINDGSRDNSWQIIQDISKTDPRFSGARLSRNFGHQSSISCGYELAQGDAVVSIDADLQDPPEVITDMVRRWEAGDLVVLAVRRSRKGETRTKLWTAGIYYKIISKISETDTPESTGDFRLLDRVAVDALKRLKETHRYIRGLVGWLGFSRGVVEYDRDPRQAGSTKYSLVKMVRLAMDGIISLSFMPLRAAYIVAFILMTPFLLYLAYSFLAYYYFGAILVPGWTSLVLAVILFGTFNLLMLGILGEYTGRIYSEVKNRPIFLVEEFCGSIDGNNTPSEINQ